MGVVPFFPKAAAEKFVIGLDFTDELADGVALTSTAVASARNRKTEADATSVLLAAGTSITVDIPNKTGKILIDGGVAGTWYEVFFLMTCSDASVIKGTAVIYVE